MADSHTTATPEATKASAITHPPVPGVQKASEPEIDRSGMLGARAIQATGGGSPETPPEQYAGALGQLPGRSQAGMLRQLQRSYGNSYVGRVIQAKLTVNQPGDIYEQEADRMADRVMTMPMNATSDIKHQTEEKKKIQTKCDKCEEEQPIQRASDRVVQAQPDLESRFNNSKGGGSPLPDEVLSFMEPRFDADFSSVRVHTGAEAVQMNRELGAQAFAHGSDIYFGAGKSPGNNELTAHELTHVVQQNGYTNSPIQRQCGVDESCIEEPNASYPEPNYTPATPEPNASYPEPNYTPATPEEDSDDSSSSFWQDLGWFATGAGVHLAAGEVPGGVIGSGANDALVMYKGNRQQQFWYGLGSTLAGTYLTIQGGVEIVGGVLTTPEGIGIPIAAHGVHAAATGLEGVGAGLAMMSGGHGNRGRRGNERHWDEDDPRNGSNRSERISDANKQELEDSGWLKKKLPNPEDRREFMKWLQKNHELGEEHVHLRPGSREAQKQLNKWMLETKE